MRRWFRDWTLAAVASWFVVAIWAGWAIVRVFGLEYGFPFEALMAFTPQMAATAFVPVAVALLLGNRAAALVAAAVLVVLAALVLPRAFGGPTDADGGNWAGLRVLAANMKLGEGNPRALVKLVDELDVDVLSVEELTPHLVSRLDKAGLRALLPERAVVAGEASHGAGLYSRVTLGPGAITRLPGGFPLITRRVTMPGAEPVLLSSVHTQPPTGPSEWREDLQALPPAGDGLRVLLGDFNATLDQDEFRDLLDRGSLDDVADTLGDGLTATWPTNRRIPPLVAIDHVLADERIGIRDYAVEDIAHSDHRAVFAELALPAASDGSVGGPD